jgi:hypothetical protein
MTRVPGLAAPLLSLGLGFALSLPAAAASDCGSLRPAERLTFTPAARTRWLAPRVRAPGPLDPLYGTVRRFLSVVQLNPFPSGECPLASADLRRHRITSQPPSVPILSTGTWAAGSPAIPTAF